MNSNSVKKINAAGTAGYVISILMIICAIAALVAACIGTAAVVAVLRDDVSVSYNTEAEINLGADSLSKLKYFIGLDNVDSIEDIVNKKTDINVSINGNEFSQIDAKEADGRVIVNARGGENKLSFKYILFYCIAGILYLASAVCALYMIKALMKSLKTCETPFSDDIIKGLTRFAYSLIPVVAFKGVLDGAKPFLSGSTEFAGTNIDLSTLLLAAVIIILIMIFKHGALLQRESDETL